MTWAGLGWLLILNHPHVDKPRDSIVKWWDEASVTATILTYIVAIIDGALSLFCIVVSSLIGLSASLLES